MHFHLSEITIIWNWRQCVPSIHRFCC